MTFADLGRRCRTAACALLLCVSPSMAHATAFSTSETPFPTNGFYVPMVKGQVDADNPLFLYEALFLPPVSPLPTGVAGVAEYLYPILLSPTTDPLAALAFGLGTMVITAAGPGSFSTCWSLGCSPDADNLFPFFEVTDLSANLFLRSDPDARRASVGAMTAVQLLGGGFAIDSVVDLFLERCIDGCGDSETAVWEDIEGSIRYEMVGDPLPAAVPEPGSFLLLASSLLALAGVSRSRRRAGRRTTDSR